MRLFSYPAQPEFSHGIKLRPGHTERVVVPHRVFAIPQNRVKKCIWCGHNIRIYQRKPIALPRRERERTRCGPAFTITVITHAQHAPFWAKLWPSKRRSFMRVRILLFVNAKCTNQVFPLKLRVRRGWFRQTSLTHVYSACGHGRISILTDKTEKLDVNCAQSDWKEGLCSVYTSGPMLKVQPLVGTTAKCIGLERTCKPCALHVCVRRMKPVDTTLCGRPNWHPN